MMAPIVAAITAAQTRRSRSRFMGCSFRSALT
jgi:hypothetical protein